MSISWEEHGIDSKKKWGTSGDDKIKSKDKRRCTYCGRIIPVNTTHIPSNTKIKVCLAL